MQNKDKSFQHKLENTTCSNEAVCHSWICSGWAEIVPNHPKELYHIFALILLQEDEENFVLTGLLAAVEEGNADGVKELLDTAENFDVNSSNKVSTILTASTYVNSQSTLYVVVLWKRTWWFALNSHTSFVETFEVDHLSIAALAVFILQWYWLVYNMDDSANPGLVSPRLIFSTHTFTFANLFAARHCTKRAISLTMTDAFHPCLHQQWFISSYDPSFFLNVWQWMVFTHTITYHLVLFSVSMLRSYLVILTAFKISWHYMYLL